MILFFGNSNITYYNNKLFLTIAFELFSTQTIDYIFM